MTTKRSDRGGALRCWARWGALVWLGLAPVLAVATPVTDTPSPTPTATETPSASPSATITQTAVCGSTFGQATFYSGGGVGNDGGNGVGWIQGTKYSVSSNGTVNAFYIYVSPTMGSNYRIGLYTDNSDYPDSLIVQSAQKTDVWGWNEIDVNPTYISSGTYWIVLIQQGSVYTWDDAIAGGSNAEMGHAATYGPLPLSISAGSYGPAGDGELRFMYASYCPGPPIFYTPTATPTATPTPIEYLSSQSVGKAAFGPVPARKGDRVCLYLPKAAESSDWEIYNLLGQRVAALSFDGAAQACWDTGAVAPGLYFVRGSIRYADGSGETLTQKVVVLK